jgi:surface protein
VFNNGAAGGEPGPPLKWNTSKVNNMIGMFERATAFNADIGGWDTSKVEYMSEMFRGASAFNQDIRRWNVSNVRNFMYMFYGASEFNQNLSDWHQLDESRVVQEEASKNGMFFNSGLSENNWPSWLRK